jgi:hypothetical protein
MSEKHTTPGPWRVAYCTQIEYGDFVASEGFAVALVLRDTPGWEAKWHLPGLPL